MKVFKFTNLDLGSGYITDNPESIIEQIRVELDDLFEGDSVSIKLSVLEMSEEEYKALPEFDGF